MDLVTKEEVFEDGLWYSVYTEDNVYIDSFRFREDAESYKLYLESYYL